MRGAPSAGVPPGAGADGCMTFWAVHAVSPATGPATRSAMVTAAAARARAARRPVGTRAGDVVPEPGVGEPGSPARASRLSPPIRAAPRKAKTAAETAAPGNGGTRNPAPTLVATCEASQLPASAIRAAAHRARATRTRGDRKSVV